MSFFYGVNEIRTEKNDCTGEKISHAGHVTWRKSRDVFYASFEGRVSSSAFCFQMPEESI